MQCRCVLIFLTIYLSGKEGPSLHIWGASLFLQRSTPCAYLHSSLLLFSPFTRVRIWIFWLWLYLCAQVVKLYERCLIACARYPEYWIRYVLCMEASGSMELAENALARANQVFVKVWNFIIVHFNLFYDSRLLIKLLESTLIWYVGRYL